MFPKFYLFLFVLLISLIILATQVLPIIFHKLAGIKVIQDPHHEPYVVQMFQRINQNYYRDVYLGLNGLHQILHCIGDFLDFEKNCSEYCAMIFPQPIKIVKKLYTIFLTEKSSKKIMHDFFPNTIVFSSIYLSPFFLAFRKEIYIFF